MTCLFENEFDIQCAGETLKIERSVLVLVPDSTISIKTKPKFWEICETHYILSSMMRGTAAGEKVNADVTHIKDVSQSVYAPNFSSQISDDPTTQP